MKIEPPPENLPNELLHLPLRLLSEKEDNEALIVNPGGELTFDLFDEASLLAIHRSPLPAARSHAKNGAHGVTRPTLI
jgi:hypothetical protein